jgi:hypothetical protein
MTIFAFSLEKSGEAKERQERTPDREAPQNSPKYVKATVSSVKAWAIAAMVFSRSPVRLGHPERYNAPGLN